MVTMGEVKSSVHAALTMYPAYSSFSTKESCSQMNSSCCRTTENSFCLKLGSVLCAKRKHISSVQVQVCYVLSKFRSVSVSDSSQSHLGVNGKFDLVSLTQGIRDVNLQHGVCLKVHVDCTWLQEDRDRVSNNAVSSTDTQRKPTVSYSVLFTYIVLCHSTELCLFRS